MNFEQYQVLCARRQAFDNMVWQTPPAAIAAQAFLLSASLDPDATNQNSIILAIVSSVVGFASIQLMAKHRHGEFEDAELLGNYESDNQNDGLTILHGKNRKVINKHSILTQLSSFKIWFFVMWLFFLFAIYVAAEAWVG